MLSEETILLILCLVAAALLIVALLDVLWPAHERGFRARSRRPRGGRRVDRARDLPDRARGGTGAPARPPGDRDRGAPVVAGDRRARRIATVSVAPAPFDPEPAGTPPHEAAAHREDLAAPSVAEQGRPGETPALAVPATATLPFEESFALYQGKRYADVIARAAPALERHREGGEPAREIAALWSIVGLSKQALEDADGARAAFEQAIQVAPAAERAIYRRHLSALALAVGRKLIGRAEVPPDPAGDERVAALRDAVLWLRQGLACVPDDESLLQALDRARADLWGAYADAAATLVQRQDFHAARRLIREALAAEGVPDDRRRQFEDLLTATFSGEIGQLTAQAIRIMQDAREREALASLQRAEGLLAMIPDEGLTPGRREEVSGRLWWGYTRLGARRVEAGEYENALEPLFHALRFGEIYPARRQETCAVLVRALDHVTEARVESIERLLTAGQRGLAAQEGVRLRAVLREGFEAGLNEDDLGPALMRSRQVLDEGDPA